MASTPTVRTVAKLRQDGYRVQIVEHWVPYAKVRRDLFGFGDVLAIRPGQILAVQCTTYSNMFARLRKIQGLPDARLWLHAGGGLEVWGWKAPTKTRRTWDVRIVRMDEQYLAQAPGEAESRG